jgi:hypothetical protein
MTRPPSAHLIRVCNGLLLLLVVSSLNARAQAEDLRTKTAVDLVHTWGSTILRVRPWDRVTPPTQTRMDVLVGRDFGSLTGYLYFKGNSRNQRFLGTRLDYTLETRGQRMRTTFQVRGFVGLNRESRKHLYVITNLNVRLDRNGRIRPGILEYGIKRQGTRGVIYVGPGLTLRPLDFLSLRLSYGFDILGRSRLLYIKSTLNL